jgi:hypothetical protein
LTGLDAGRSSASRRPRIGPRGGALSGRRRRRRRCG